MSNRRPPRQNSIYQTKANPDPVEVRFGTRETAGCDGKRKWADRFFKPRRKQTLHNPKIVTRKGWGRMRQTGKVKYLTSFRAEGARQGRTDSAVSTTRRPVMSVGFTAGESIRGVRNPNLGDAAGTEDITKVVHLDGPRPGNKRQGHYFFSRNCSKRSAPVVASERGLAEDHRPLCERASTTTKRRG